MESLNKVNGIVERNQWNRSTKSMALFLENDEMKTKKRHFTAFSPPFFFG